MAIVVKNVPSGSFVNAWNAGKVVKIRHCPAIYKRCAADLRALRLEPPESSRVPLYIASTLALGIATAFFTMMALPHSAVGQFLSKEFFQAIDAVQKHMIP